MAHPSTRPTSPWSELRQLREQMDRILSSAFGGSGSEREVAEWSPAVDITERDDALLLTAELPGLSRDDIEVELENNVLTIRGEKKQEHEETKAERYVYERRYGSFARSFTLPRTVDASGIRARFDNGVLTITMPKSEETKGQRIDIEGGAERTGG